MKLRHAAALALVGWYLFMHPCVQGAKGCATGSIWQMDLGGIYATKEACEKKGGQTFDELIRSGEAASRSIYGVIWECVTPDDPRLKSN